MSRNLLIKTFTNIFSQFYHSLVSEILSSINGKFSGSTAIGIFALIGDYPFLLSSLQQVQYTSAEESGDKKPITDLGVEPATL